MICLMDQILFAIGKLTKGLAGISDKEYAYDFLSFLSKFKKSNNHLVDIFEQKEEKCIKSPDFLNYSTFKALVCELFYNAINSIPDIITEDIIIVIKFLLLIYLYIKT